VTKPMTWAALVALGSSWLAGCASRTTLCTAASACPPGHACEAGRCTKGPATEPPPVDTQRVVVAPREIAVVSSRGTDSALGDEIPLGGSKGSVIVLLRFPAPWGNRVRIASAFLTLEPSPGSLPHLEPVHVAVSRVLEPWSAADVSWGRLPRRAQPEAFALATFGPPKTLRIDVTTIVRGWARGRPDDQGIALTAPPEAGVGAAFSTGVTGAAGPRLDVYLR
jgi:hypothetical protein